MEIVEYMPDYLKHVELGGWVKSAFISRLDGVQVSTDKDAVVAALEPEHFTVSKELGFEKEQFYRATQVHGNVVEEILSLGQQERMIEGVDGLMTKLPGVLLGIYVADCGAIYIVDPEEKGIALLHSGKKGTEGNILGEAITKMKESWGSKSKHLKVLLAPCIRPPHYEIDFAATIKEQAIAAGVTAENYHDCGLCTGECVGQFYSYRIEKGNTGRNLALLGISS